MKKIICMAAALAMLFAVGCEERGNTGDQNEELSDVTVPEENEEPAEDAWLSSAEYDISVSVDKTSRIKRYTLNAYTDVMELYYEIPVFGKEVAAYREINAFFENTADEFFKSENVTDAIESAKEHFGEDKYRYARNAEIVTENEKLVSVTTDYDWFMGGVADYGSDSWTFDAENGALLSLSDVTKMSDDELRPIIFSALENELPDGDTSLLDSYSVNDFEFSVRDGKSYIKLDKYEASYGAAGEFEIALPVEIKD